MGPESQLLVYYVREDEETVAATLTFKVKKCFDNKVNLQTILDWLYYMPLSTIFQAGSFIGGGVPEENHRPVASY